MFKCIFILLLYIIHLIFWCVSRKCERKIDCTKKKGKIRNGVDMKKEGYWWTISGNWRSDGLETVTTYLSIEYSLTRPLIPSHSLAINYVYFFFFFYLELVWSEILVIYIFLNYFLNMILIFGLNFGWEFRIPKKSKFLPFTKIYSLLN